MKNYIYSPSQNIIFPIILKQYYVDSGTWPNDFIEISDATAEEFSQQFPQGKMLSHDENNQPCWIDLPPPTTEDIIATAGAKKLRLRKVTDSEIEWRQDAVDAGIATGEETAALAEWKKYRVLLMRVDTITPEWPILPKTQTR